MPWTSARSATRRVPYWTTRPAKNQDGRARSFPQEVLAAIGGKTAGADEDDAEWGQGIGAHLGPVVAEGQPLLGQQSVVWRVRRATATGPGGHRSWIPSERHRLIGLRGHAQLREDRPPRLPLRRSREAPGRGVQASRL